MGTAQNPMTCTWAGAVLCTLVVLVMCTPSTASSASDGLNLPALRVREMADAKLLVRAVAKGGKEGWVLYTKNVTSFLGGARVVPMQPLGATKEHFGLVRLQADGAKIVSACRLPAPIGNMDSEVDAKSGESRIVIAHEDGIAVLDALLNKIYWKMDEPMDVSRTHLAIGVNGMVAHSSYTLLSVYDTKGVQLGNRTVKKDFITSLLVDDVDTSNAAVLVGGFSIKSYNRQQTAVPYVFKWQLPSFKLQWKAWDTYGELLETLQFDAKVWKMQWQTVESPEGEISVPSYKEVVILGEASGPLNSFLMDASNSSNVFNNSRPDRLHDMGSAIGVSSIYVAKLDYITGASNNGTFLRLEHPTRVWEQDHRIRQATETHLGKGIRARNGMASLPRGAVVVGAAFGRAVPFRDRLAVKGVDIGRNFPGVEAGVVVFSPALNGRERWNVFTGEGPKAAKNKEDEIASEVREVKCNDQLCAVLGTLYRGHLAGVNKRAGIIGAVDFLITFEHDESEVPLLGADKLSDERWDWINDKDKVSKKQGDGQAQTEQVGDEDAKSVMGESAKVISEDVKLEAQSPADDEDYEEVDEDEEDDENEKNEEL